MWRRDKKRDKKGKESGTKRGKLKKKKTGAGDQCLPQAVTQCQDKSDQIFFLRFFRRSGTRRKRKKANLTRNTHPLCPSVPFLFFATPSHFFTLLGKPLSVFFSVSSPARPSYHGPTFPLGAAGMHRNGVLGRRCQSHLHTIYGPDGSLPTRGGGGVEGVDGWGGGDGGGHTGQEGVGKV